MNWKSKAVGAVCAFALCVSAEAFGQALPDGPGKVEFVHNCTACHRADMVTRVPKTPDDWKKNVFEMASRGADGTKEDLDKVVVYLVANYSTNTAAPAPAMPAAAQAALTSSEIDLVTGLIADNGCLICHRIEKQGGYTGPSLNGVGARRTPDQIRSSIVHPPAKLDPQNVSARVTTADGKTTIGRVVSQDDHTVRIITVTGEVVSYSKPELREFTILDANPMLSFEKRIAKEDLEVLVRYLSSLPALNENVQK